jgi:hypothetical protein
VLAREGEGWRLAWDAQRHAFPLLIGGEGWATELTATEGQALLKAIRDLRAQHAALVDSLMEEETIALEHTASVFPASGGEEAGELWVALEGDRNVWSLRFVLQPPAGKRGLEGAWGEGAAEAFARACAGLEEAAAAHGG